MAISERWGRVVTIASRIVRNWVTVEYSDGERQTWHVHALRADGGRVEIEDAAGQQVLEPWEANPNFIERRR